MSGVSRFLRTTWMLTAKQTLDFGDFYAKVRFVDTKEASELTDLVRKRHVFARHSWENNGRLNNSPRLFFEILCQNLL